MAQETKAEAGISKIDAVRKIIGTHGKETMPVAIVGLAKKEHGVKLTVGTASNYKSAVLRELGSATAEKPKPKAAGAKRGPKPGWKKVASNGAATHGGSISIDDIAAVKKVVEAIGADKVEQLARVLAK